MPLTSTSQISEVANNDMSKNFHLVAKYHNFSKTMIGNFKIIKNK
jgi:hypothetical protein